MPLKSVAKCYRGGINYREVFTLRRVTTVLTTVIAFINLRKLMCNGFFLAILMPILEL